MSHSPINDVYLLVLRHLIFALKLTGKSSLCISNSFEKFLQSLQGINTTFPCSSHFGHTAKSKEQWEEHRIPLQRLTRELCPGHAQLQSPTAPCSSLGEHFVEAFQEQRCFGR